MKKIQFKPDPDPDPDPEVNPNSKKVSPCLK